MAITDTNVKAIIETELDTTPFIETAELIVTEDLQGKGLSSERLDQITLYLAAHFVCITEERGGLRRSETGEAGDSYITPTEVKAGLEMTRYGQQALMLDSSGTLSKISSGTKLKAKFDVLSTLPSCP